jgi:hypothetical protein
LVSWAFVDDFLNLQNKKLCFEWALWQMLFGDTDWVRRLRQVCRVAAQATKVEQRPQGQPNMLPTFNPESPPAKQADTRQKLIDAVNVACLNEKAVGYAEISGDTLTVHSERASAMRFHMIVANQQWLTMMRQAGIATFAYTDDGDQHFLLDVKSGHESPDVTAKQKVLADPSRHCNEYSMNVDGGLTCSAWSR